MVFEHDAVVVLGGVPGAGKSTLLRRAVDHDEVAVVDTDLRRAAGTASRWKSVRVFQHYTALWRAVAGGRPVVLHSRGTTAFARRAVVRLARLHSRPAHLLLLDASREEAVEGQLDRGRTIAAHEMDLHVRRFARLLRTRGAGEGWRSVTVLDRTAAAALPRLTFYAAARSDQPCSSSLSSSAGSWAPEAP